MASVHLCRCPSPSDSSNPLLRRRRIPSPPSFACPRRSGVQPRLRRLPPKRAQWGGGSCCLRVSCAASPDGLSARWPGNAGGGVGDFVEAVLLVDDIIRHRHLRQQHFAAEGKRHFSAGSIHLPTLAKGQEVNVSFMSDEFLRQFKNPTLFLKVSCGEDLLLPIIVGESAVEKLVEAVSMDDKMECPDEFQFATNLVQFLGNELKMVRITERVVNTYYARIYFGKPGEMPIIDLDARPSDAINLATRLKAPIYVNKQIVLADALRYSYGKWGGYRRKCTYDVLLDSAPDGPDTLLEELDLLEKMEKAVRDERYKDAATWRDRLVELRRAT